MSVVLRVRAALGSKRESPILPCLPSPAAKPPAGSDWLHEIKQDGFRLMARRDGGGVRLLTRNGYDWTARYPLIADAVGRLPCRSCLIDGEAIVADAAGLAVFELLRNRRNDHAALLYAFDLIELDGADLRSRTLEARKQALGRILRRARPGVQFAKHVDDIDPADLYRHACRMGIEGIVSKRRGSRYRSGRSRDWIKIKNPSAPAARRLEDEDWNDRSRRQ